jgi:hypothetical protein
MTDKPRTGKKIGKLKSFGLDLHIAAYTQATDKGAPDRIASFEVDPQPSSGLNQRGKFTGDRHSFLCEKLNIAVP